MTFSYAPRLICVCLAAFTVLFALCGLLVSLSIPLVLRMVREMSAAAAARFILWLRLMPATMAGLAIIVICIPSYIRFEQRAEPEQVGLTCLVLAFLSLLLFGLSMARTALACLRSLNPRAALALVGVLRQRIVVSKPVRDGLSADQLAMAICHEEAHAQARDNFKRLLMLLAPGMFPGVSALERNWKRFAEWAADDCAVAGDPLRSVSLAGALVQVARLGAAGEPSPLATSLLANANELEARVDRLLNPAPIQRNPHLSAFAAASAWSPAILIVAMLHPAVPARIHDLLEHLLR
jgi:Zn-dependent protease with chaperone function